jgi:hypothetical protein
MDPLYTRNSYGKLRRESKARKYPSYSDKKHLDFRNELCHLEFFDVLNVPDFNLLHHSLGGLQIEMRDHQQLIAGRASFNHDRVLLVPGGIFVEGRLTSNPHVAVPGR